MYNAYITKIKNVHKHPNADRLLLGECFGNQVVVGLDTAEGQVGIYFPCDGKLHTKFLVANNLIGSVDPETGIRSGGFFDERGKVRAQKFRGEKSDGYFCSVSSLAFTGVNINTLNEGMAFTEINGAKICEKYVTEKTQASMAG